jgi:hypothetical protein
MDIWVILLGTLELLDLLRLEMDLELWEQNDLDHQELNMGPQVLEWEYLIQHQLHISRFLLLRQKKSPRLLMA